MQKLPEILRNIFTFCNNLPCWGQVFPEKIIYLLVELTEDSFAAAYYLM